MALVCALIISTVTFAICMAGLVIGKKFAASGFSFPSGGPTSIDIFSHNEAFVKTNIKKH
jgi:hypothetical protein